MGEFFRRICRKLGKPQAKLKDILHALEQLSSSSSPGDSCLLPRDRQYYSSEDVRSL
jgi:hypothetical protein